MQTSDFARLVRHAYENWPFYKWLYTNAGVQVHDRISQNELPLISKQDLFHYQDVTGEMYFSSWKYPKGYQFEDYLGSTGTTTGRPFIVPMECFANSYYTIPNVVRSLKPAGRKIAVSEANPAVFSKFIQRWTEVEGIEVVTVPIHSDPHKVADFLAKNRPDVLHDIRSDITRSLILNSNAPLDTFGVKYVIALERYVVDKWTQVGVIPLQLYVGTDHPVCHLGCEYCYPNVHIRAPRSQLKISIKSAGGLEEFGTGQFVATIFTEVFPFINYVNGDIVRIFPDKCKCGFTGTSLQFIGRQHTVKIGGDGPNIDLYTTHYRISERLNGLNVIHLIVNILEGTLPRTGLLTIIEKEGIEIPMLLESGWRMVLESAGGPREGEFPLSHLLPVVMCPPRTIQVSSALKIPVYIDLRANCPDSWEGILKDIGSTCNLNMAYGKKK